MLRDGLRFRFVRDVRDHFGGRLNAVTRTNALGGFNAQSAVTAAKSRIRLLFLRLHYVFLVSHAWIDSSGDS